MTTILVDTNEEIERSSTLFLTPKQLCERALRKINAYSINDTAADPEHLEEALFWLDLIVGEIAGTNRCSWLIGTAVGIALDADTQTYSLADAMGNDLPSGRALFPTAAYLRDSSGTDSPVSIVKRDDWNAIEDKDTTGIPECVYIDRLTSQNISVYPVPTTNDYTLYVDVQTYARNMTAANGVVRHGLPAEWQLYLVLELSGYVGDGPIRRINANTLRMWKAEADKKRDRLLAWSNQEQPGQTGMVRTKPWGA